MKLDSSVTDRILEAVSMAPSWRMDDLVSLFPNLTWNQVFCEVTRLSTRHQVSVILDSQGSFVVSLPGVAPGL
jgi:hypothetical protein